MTSKYATIVLCSPPLLKIFFIVKINHNEGNPFSNLIGCEPTAVASVRRMTSWKVIRNLVWKKSTKVFTVAVHKALQSQVERMRLVSEKML